jgi:hypothetical protein
MYIILRKMKIQVNFWQICYLPNLSWKYLFNFIIFGIEGLCWTKISHKTLIDERKIYLGQVPRMHKVEGNKRIALEISIFKKEMNECVQQIYMSFSLLVVNKWGGGSWKKLWPIINSNFHWKQDILLNKIWKSQQSLLISLNFSYDIIIWVEFC